MKLNELHDWHMFPAASQLGLNVNVRLLWMGSPSAVYERHDGVAWQEMCIMVKRV